MTEAAAGIIKNKNGQYLICQRAEKSDNGGLWEFPGGRREKDENLSECLERELLKKLSVKVEVGEVICKKEVISDGKELSITFFEYFVESGKISANTHNDFKWVFPRNFKKYTFCPPDSQVAAEIAKKDKGINIFYILKICLFYLLMFTWCLPETLVGFIMFLIFIKERHEFYHGAIVTYHNKNWGGVSFGAFTFVQNNKNASWRCNTRSHEFGHCIQSLFSGPFSLLIFTLPSSVWCNLKFFKKYRKNNKVSYNSFFTEKSANKLSMKFLREYSD